MAIQTVDDINATPSLQKRLSFLLMAVISSLIHALFLGILFVATENPFLREADTRKLSVIPIHLSPPVLHHVTREDSIRQASSRRMIAGIHDVSGGKRPSPINAAASQFQIPAPLAKTPMQDISGTVGSGELPPPPGNQTETVTLTTEVLLPATSGIDGNYPATGVDRSVVKPRYNLTPSPAYPITARTKGQEGVVLLSVEVLANGRTGQVQVKKSSGYTLLDQSAQNAIRTWRFEPAKRLQTPRTMIVDIPIRFSLKKDR